MTANGRDLIFKNRVKKMLAEKVVGKPKGISNNRTTSTYKYNSGKTSVGVLKPEEIVITDDEASNVVKNNGDRKPRKKLKSEKKKNEMNLVSDVKQFNDDSHETMSKQNVREKRRRIEKAKIRRQESCLKKQKKISKEKRPKRKKSAPENPWSLIDELNPDDNDVSFEHNNGGNEPTKFLEKRMKFGEPTMIEGTPKSPPKLPLFSSAVSNLNPTSTASNSRGNILSNFLSDNEDSNLAIFRNVAMTARTFDDCGNETTDDVEENDADSFYENVESSDCDTDISFVSSEEDSGPNLSSNQMNNGFAPEAEPGDPIVSETDSKEKPEFYSLHNKVVAIMGPSCKFYFNGKFRVKVLIGKVEIYGFVFSKSETVVPAEIYSPRGSSLVSIETIPHESDDNSNSGNLYSLLINEGINKGIATDMRDKIKEFPDGQAVLILESLENTLTKYLDFYYPFKLFPKTEDSTNYHNRHPKKAEKLLQATFQYDDLGKQLKKDRHRESKILYKFLNPSDPDESQRILISGGKGVGKSTTLRYLVNGLLPTRDEIVVVDFDPGQPEFTPPGCISLNIIDRPLTGPNFTHLKTPFYQIFIGDINVARCVPRYVKAVRQLVEYLNNSPRLQGLTVLINTMGFCDGIGWDLMAYIIKLIHPSSVVQITSERLKNNFRYLLNNEVINDQIPTRFTGGESESSVWEVPCNHELHVVPSLAEGKGKFGDSWEMEPRQLRDISLLAYLSKIPKENEEDGQFLISQLPRINDTIPYSVPMSKLTISLIRTMVPASHILATMNGNIVALCGIDAAHESSDSHTAVDFYPKTLLRAPISTCYGFGIVRGVDMKNGNVFINTPLSIDQLKYVNSLIGSIPLPTILISSDRRNAPYISGGEDLPTSREPRRGYFRMRRRNNS